MTQSSYNADAIEVLTGLEPVRRRPGMYTDTTRPNHLGQEVIDNSVDEALAGHAKRVEVILHADQSLEVIDDGRGMPVDIHPEEGVPAVELILCRLHAGGKFSNKNYQFSGGLHGVGISVVNALSKRVEVNVRRDGQVYSIAFENGEKGMVQDIRKDTIGCILFGKDTGIKEGTKVVRTKKKAGIPVGENFIGRVINALGEPVDGKGPVKEADYYPVEREAPGIVDRKSVSVPMETGILSIDSMFPIGRGQRELIIGDRQTGKTSIANDTIGKDIDCH